MLYKRLYLKLPTFKELSYRQKLLSDIETMSYNKGFDDFPKTRLSAEKVFSKLGFKRLSNDYIELKQEC